MTAFELMNDDIVLMYPDETFGRGRISKVGELAQNIKDFFYSCELPHKGWLDGTGVDCEVLQAQGGGWQGGKIKLSMKLEFIPDELAQDSRPVSRYEGSPPDNVSPNPLI
ncbi:MAG: KGK domain-containing protein [Nostoc sp. ChiSLP01]|nr:KGK domain-containing protein [Nostoc sp. CmiSLP01]MDZ8287354.1 KGK domain-containing protein [Nostoc sp. ChiSLP01]